jgi:plastocyanin
MSNRIYLLIAALAASMLLAGCTGGTDGDDDDIKLVRIESHLPDGFNPTEETIPAGGTILWRNVDNAAHTVTSDDGLFDSGNLAPGDEFRWTFDEPGEYPYNCIYHPGQEGVIIVTEADE